MANSIHLLCAPEGSGKTRRLAERFLEVSGSGIGAALWIGPTRRHVEAVRDRLLCQQSALLGVHLLTFQEFAEEVIRGNDPAARPLSDVQRRLVLDGLIADLHGRGELAYFDAVIDSRGFREGIAELVAELKRREIWPADFARAAYRRGQGAVAPRDRQCARLYAKYQQWLMRRNLYDVEGRFWYARDLLARGLRRPFESVRAIFVDGFVTFSRTQREIFQALTASVDEIWNSLPDEAEGDRGELFNLARATRTKLASGGRQPPEGEQNPPSIAVSQGADAPRSPGLHHIERQLFRPLRSVVQADHAEGLLLIQAPGMVGEARLAARQIKSLLLEGVPAGEIVVALRDLDAYADLLREVFGEYGIPIEMAGIDPLQRQPAVAVLLRACRLPDEDWPFAGVGALLRSSFLRPDWPETQSDPAVPQHAEALLRILGEPRGREAYLSAVNRWAEQPPALPEGEEGSEGRRRKTHELAQRCRAYLHRFFRAWDHVPGSAPLAAHVNWLRQLADELGIVGCAGTDRPAIDRFFAELDGWGRHSDRQVSRAGFLRMLTTVAATAGLPRTPRGPGRVRVLSAEEACGIDVTHLFVMGLGEGSFPNLAAPEPIFDEADRQAFARAGLDFPSFGDRLTSEMLLFYQLVTRARCRLVLSYPAVDGKGQELLPSSFLTALRDCFQSDAIEAISRKMLIERYAEETLLSPVELRVRLTKEWPPPAAVPAFAADSIEQLRAARVLVDQRLHGRLFTPYDGLLRDPSALAEVRKRWGDDRLFSPTALEDYGDCPFRFFFKHVLRFEPLEDPRDEIEQTRRGIVFHRALARLHGELREAGVHRPDPTVNDRLLARLDEAVREHIEESASPANRELWRLEGIRLRRTAALYESHWLKYLAPWAEHQVAPRPERFEVGFGLKGAGTPLTIQVDNITVRVGGRIDRIDVAELADGLGFWIIDYKTGKSQHYTGAALTDLEQLQLSLYAVAAEEVLFPGQNARPLGLAYWLVTETGCKTALPGRASAAWFQDPEAWPRFREQVKRWVAELARHIRQGDFPLRPRSEDCTATCDFGQVCRISQSRSAAERKEWRLELPLALDQ